MLKRTDSVTKSALKQGDGSFTWFLARLLLAVLILRIFVVAPFTIPSQSMMPTLLQGDFLLAAKWPYGWSRRSVPFDLPLIPGRIAAGEPERGDIVIFRHPSHRADYIKRAIGLPGDTVAMRDGQIMLNGRSVPRAAVEDFAVRSDPQARCVGAARRETRASSVMCHYTRYRETLPGGRTYDVLDFGRTPLDDFGPVTVPPGRILVLGDNRDNSQDSRFAPTIGGGVGLLDQRLLVARAGIVAFSTDGSARWNQPATWLPSVRWNRTGQSL